jgi:hypothetical protein
MHGNTKYTAENFSQIASEIHKNFYSYEKVNYSSYRDGETDKVSFVHNATGKALDKLKAGHYRKT